MRIPGFQRAKRVEFATAGLEQVRRLFEANHTDAHRKAYSNSSIDFNFLQSKSGSSFTILALSATAARNIREHTNVPKAA